MFVPLSRLYDFLDQFVDDDVIIYRFYPHGSRKLSDISPLHFYSKYNNYQSILASIPMLLHDQEPLHFDLYKDVGPKEILMYMEKHQLGKLERLQQRGTLSCAIDFLKSKNLDIFYGQHIADCWLLCHSEKDSSELSKYQSLGAVGVYWWSHAMIARDWYRYAKIDQRLNYSSMNFDKDYNVYNRSWSGTREYRLKFAQMVIQNNLLPSTSIKISIQDNGIHYRDHIFRNSKFNISIDLSILESNQFGPTASADYSYEDYQKSAIDVVLETLFDDSRLHLTEKTLRPIACGKPFIIVSTPGTLKYLREYGFETFGEYIDESYDTVTDPLDRLESIIKSMKSISSLPNHKKQYLYQKLHDIAQRNKERFWSNDFAQQVVNEFEENYQRAYAICKKSQNGEKILKLWEELSYGAQSSRQEMIDMIAKIKSQL